MFGMDEFVLFMEFEVDFFDVFFYRYFVNKMEKVVVKKKKVDKKMIDDDDQVEFELDVDGEFLKKKFDDSEFEGDDSEDEFVVEEININDVFDSEDDEEFAILFKKICKNDFKEDSDDVVDEEFGKFECQEEVIEDE